MANKQMWRSTIIRLPAAAARWIKNHFTPAGRFILVVLAVSATLGMDTNQSVAYQVFTFLLALVVLSFVSSLAAPPRLQVQRWLPGSAMVGEPILYRLIIQNLDKREHSDLVLSENIPPGNETLRVPETTLPNLSRFGTSEIQAEVRPVHRGKLNLTAIHVSRPDKLGITRRSQTIPVDSSILVLPKRYRVPPLNLPGSRKYQPGGVALSSSIGESMEFESLRDYRPGDPVRRIHWRSWARTGKLIVKEYQDEYFVRHGLVLDTFPSANNPAIFEEAVSVAASFACSVLTQESLLDLLFVGADAYRFTAGRGLGGPEKMLEVLACVEPCTHRPFQDLHYNVVSRHNSLSGCICVLLAWDEARQEFVRHLESLRVPVLAVVINDSSISPITTAPAHHVHVVDIARIAEGLARL